MNANNENTTHCFIVEKIYIQQFKQKKFKLIKEMKKISKANVWLYPIPNVDYQVCQLTGSDANIQLALSLIAKQIPQINLENVILTPSPVSGFEINQEALIRITSFMSPAHFYGQLASYTNYTELDRTNQNLNETYNQEAHYLTATELKVQNPCAVLHEGNWYRATIVAVGTDIVVRLLDYGNVVTTTIRNLKKLLPAFHYLSFQAIECKLDNLQSSQGEWSEEVRSFMEDMAKKPNKIKLKSFDGNRTLMVELFASLTHSNWTSINATLINKKYASFLIHPLESAGDYEYEIAERAETQREGIHISIGSEFLSDMCEPKCNS